jgi:putative ATP-dependent endonuclease of the OLD family
MPYLRLNSIEIKNYRSFDGEGGKIIFPNYNYETSSGKPISIVGYNNTGKTNVIKSVLYTMGVEWLGEDTFSEKDFFNCDKDKELSVVTNFEHNVLGLDIQESRIYIERKLDKWRGKATSFWKADEDLPIYYINFHEIKKQLETKSSWGNIKTFLGKTLKRFKINNETAHKIWVENNLSKVIDTFVNNVTDFKQFREKPQTHLKEILRKDKDDFELKFGLPDYDDIFYKMVFSLKTENGVLPIENFGDGYVSMFIIAMLQAIAQDNNESGNLFIFEEPETFLHENHQEYFYKKVLCELAKKNQVIYTTHSKKMVDIFSPETIIRLSHDGKSTKVYQAIGDFEPELPNENLEEGQIATISYELDKYTDNSKFIQQIEPNLGKLVFSDKVILVEGPMDVLAYSQAISVYFNDQHYLNYNNIAILPVHGKDKSIILVQICKALKVDYFVVHDWDLDNDINPYTLPNIEVIAGNEEIDKAKKKLTADRGQWTKNQKILEIVNDRNRIHFNKRNLEMVLQIDKKNDFELWKKVQELIKSEFPKEFLPDNLIKFINNKNISQDEEGLTMNSSENETSESEIPKFNRDQELPEEFYAKVQMPF